MFDKILIANRGEIACRIMRTARRLGIRTVAVYSEADADALHVREADEAVAIGPAPSAQSYLVIDRIVEAAKRTGAEAVAPGYGFLSEKQVFAERLASEGIVFIGPNPRAIGAMGDKIESKKLARDAGVSTVPGYLGALDSEDAAVSVAAEIGYPVMLKASAGGGGKGMRIVRSDGEMREALRATRSEAKASFADDRVFLEKYIEHPRHIEIQVLGDRYGTVLHLGERECSLQRRHQKVIEEAPSPLLDETTRAAMGAQAVALAQAVGYDSAGTVEFIVDSARNFYFLEMNTRLQVEHPVTEYVVGLDLVEWMIRIAAGEMLPFTQDQIKLCGWAIEARVYAEDPARNFLPSIGRLGRYRPPEGPGLRIDTGVYEGAEISIHYDPMIAKVIAAGEDRAQASARLVEALDRFDIQGLTHNIDFLTALARHDRFAAGDLSTHLIAEEYPDGYAAAAPMGWERAVLVAIAAARHHVKALRDASGRGYRPPEDWVVQSMTGRDAARIVSVRPDAVDVETDGGTIALRGSLDPATDSFVGTADGIAIAVRLKRQGREVRLSRGGHAMVVTVLSHHAAELTARMPEKLPPDTSRLLLSPMPGLLVSVAVAVGDEVKAGETLAVVEAMKMENVLRAERAGRVRSIPVKAGDSLSVDQIILEFE